MPPSLLEGSAPSASSGHRLKCTARLFPRPGSAQYELAGLILIATGQTSYGATLQIETEDGEVVTRELDDFSFAQAQVNMHMGKKVRSARPWSTSPPSTAVLAC